MDVINIEKESTPEFYGYKIGQNVAPYINKCINDTGKCYLSAGEHILGRNDRNWNEGNPWNDNGISWGWNRVHNVQLIGAGKDKTTIRLIDNSQSKEAFGNKDIKYILMLQTNYSVSCDNTLIEGITWDGNYQNNNDSVTIFGIRIRGENTIINGCRFINFGVGKYNRAECFQLVLGPIDPNGKGPTIINNIFEKIGNKSGSPAGFVPENTLIAVSGINPIIKNNIFSKCIFDRVNQQSPLHAITLGGTKDAIIEANLFDSFHGACIYMDSWKNENVVIKQNIAYDVWAFIGFLCKKWDDPNQIFNITNCSISQNTISLSNGETTHQWDAVGYPSAFFGYVNDPLVTENKFNNITIVNNKITLGYLSKNGVNTESSKMICFYGNRINPEIDLTSNIFTSTVPETPKKVSIIKKIVTAIITKIKSIFGKK